VHRMDAATKDRAGFKKFFEQGERLY